MNVSVRGKAAQTPAAQSQGAETGGAGLIKEAKCLLMERNHMSEEEAYRYIQKCSMDSSTSMVETAKMVLTTMQY